MGGAATECRSASARSRSRCRSTGYSLQGWAASGDHSIADVAPTQRQELIKVLRTTGWARYQNI